MRTPVAKVKPTSSATVDNRPRTGPALSLSRSDVSPLSPLQPTNGHLLSQHAPRHLDEDVDNRPETHPSIEFGHDISQVSPYPGGFLPVQAKLTVSTPGDAHERAAEQVADEVMRSNPVGKPQQSGNLIQQLKAPQQMINGRGAPDEALQKRLSHSTRVGSPLPANTRGYLEDRMRHDFASVRIHTGDEANLMNRQLGARAFTYGQDIYFAAGEYAPQTARGTHLLAHELAHVVQQRANVVQRENGSPTDGIDRDWLIQRIAFRMNLAFTKYVDAASEHQRSIRQAIADQAAMAGVLLDVILAFAAPGLGRFLSRAISRAVATDASLATYRLALAAMDRSDQIIAASTAVAKPVAIQGFSDAIAREESEQFVQALKQRFSVVLDRIHGSLPSKTDEELAVLYANYDPELATTALYEQQIGVMVRRYQAQVAPIGEGRFEVSQAHILQTENRAYWIELPAGTYLGLVETPETVSFGFPSSLRFIGWIGESMSDLAIEKTRQVTGRDPERIKASEVDGISIADIVSMQPPIATG